MTDAIAFAGTYADIKTVKTRGVFQVLVEIPIEKYAEFVGLFGGPLPGQERPVALAMMDKTPAPSSSRPAVTSAGNAPLDREQGRRFIEALNGPTGDAKSGIHPLVQKAGILAKSVDFQKWADRQMTEWMPTGGKTGPEDWAVHVIRDHCGIRSRKELASNPEAAKRFEALVQRYYTETR